MDERLCEAVGLPGAVQELDGLLQRTSTKFLRDHPDYDTLLASPDSSGVTVSSFGIGDGERDMVLTVSIPGAAPTAVRAEVFQVAPGVAHVDVLDDDGRLAVRLLAMVDDPHMYPVYPLQAVGERAHIDQLHMGAIAVDVAVYASFDDWEAAVDSDGADPLRGSMFLICPWLFALYDGSAAAEEANSAAMFRGICREVQLVTNVLSGRTWYRVIADSALPVVLALPGDTSPAPVPGSVIDGRVALTATTGFWRIGAL